MDAAERALLEKTVSEAVASAPADGGAAIDTILADLGWFEMLRTDARDAVDIVFEALGRTNAAASVLDDVVIEGLGIEARADLAVLLPAFASWDAPGQVENGSVSASGLASARVAGATEVVIVCHTGSELSVASVPTAVLDISSVRGADPDAGLHRVRVERQPADPAPLGPAAWDAAVASGRVAIGHQVAASCRAMLDLAREHARERVQFGQPVARFQAVRHRLADALVAVEALEASLTAAADEPGSMTTALAKALAGRAARIVSGHCQQVLAGIGFTTDHPFHRFLKRTMTLDGLFGSADAITLELGRQLLASRRVPTLIEL
jgi:Acyl-CoA dehydrogenase, C-terminal domain